MSKYGVISGPHFPVFSPNTGKYRPEITPHLDIFQAVNGAYTLSQKMSYQTNKVLLVRDAPLYIFAIEERPTVNFFFFF